MCFTEDDRRLSDSLIMMMTMMMTMMMMMMTMMMIMMMMISRPLPSAPADTTSAALTARRGNMLPQIQKKKVSNRS